MAQPKKKMSRARTHRRRAQWKLAVPGLIRCPQCHELKLPHRVCPVCGHYGTKEVVKVEKAE